MGSTPGAPQAAPPTAFEQLMQQLTALPLWEKQVINIQLRQELERTMSKSTMEAYGEEHTLQMWIPEVTRGGIMELERPSGIVDAGALRLMHMCRFHKDVVNIAVLNNWTLEQTATYLLSAIEAQFVTPPRSQIIMSTIEYMVGRTRLGEYLVKINRLTVSQLDQALRTQKYIEESMGERTGIANVLINLGYIKKEDSEGILFLKEESKKPFKGMQFGGATAADTMKLQAQLNQAMQRIRQLEGQNPGGGRPLQ